MLVIYRLLFIIAFLISQKGKSMKHSHDTPEKDNTEKLIELIKSTLSDKAMKCLYLPTKWKDTKKKRACIAYDPEKKQSIDLSGQVFKIKNYSESPISFLKNKDTRFETQETESAKSEKVTKLEEAQLIVEDSNGQHFTICPAHGQITKIEDTVLDHIKPVKEIKKEQQAFLKKMNTDKNFAKKIMKLKNIENFFVKVNGEYWGTLLYYTVQFNDMSNLWLVCSACNRKKSAKKPQDFLCNQWTFGEDFKKYLDNPKNKDIIKEKGWEETASSYFWNTHANHVHTTLRIHKEILFPLQEKAKKADEARKSGSKGTRRRETTLKRRLSLLSRFSRIKGVDCPRGLDETPGSSPDSNYLQLSDDDEPITPGTYERINEIAINRAIEAYEKTLREEAKKSNAEKKQDERKRHLSTPSNHCFFSKEEQQNHKKRKTQPGTPSGHRFSSEEEQGKQKKRERQSLDTPSRHHFFSGEDQCKQKKIKMEKKSRVSAK